MKYIDNAQVYTIEAYETVHPLTQEEADAGHITGNENCTIPQSLSIDYASYGYVDLQAGFSTFNHINGEIHNGEVNLVYDATKQGTGHAQTATLLQSAHSRRMDKNKPSLPYRIMRYLFSIFSPTMERFADPRH